MKQRMIKTITASITLSLAVMCTSIAVSGNELVDMSSDEGRFEIATPQSLASGNESVLELRYLSDEYIAKVLAEKTAFTQETRPLLHDLMIKWAALAEELTAHPTEASTAILLQHEIRNLGTQLAQKRLDHLLALNHI
jgi:hypothetical protein